MTRSCCLLIAGLCLAAGSSSAQTAQWTDVSGPPTCAIVTRGLGGKIFAASSPFLSDYSENYNGKLLYSLDSGQSWQLTTMTYGSIRQVVVHGTRIVVYREIQSINSIQVLLSTDEGVTWKGILSSDYPQIVGFMIAPSGSVYGLARVLRTGASDFTLARYTGTRWVYVGSTLRIYGDAVSTTAMDSCGTVYLGTGKTGVWISSDTGATWRQTLPARSISYLQAGTCGNVLVGITPNPVVTGGVFVSLDTGRTWSLLGLAHNKVSSVATDDIGTIYASTDVGVFRYLGTSLDWQAVGPVPDRIDEVVSTSPGVLVAVSADQGIFRSGDSGATWSKSDVRGQDISAVGAIGADTLLVGTYGKRIFYSYDAGEAWSQVTDPSCGEYVYGFARSGASMFAATDAGLCRSGGVDRWTNLTAQVFTGGAYTVATAAPGTVVTGSSYGVYRSGDEGTSWELVLMAGERVSSLSGDRRGYLLASTASAGTYLSTDNGSSWALLPVARDDIECSLITEGGRLALGVNGGVLLSTDGGESWALNAFAGTPVYSLAGLGSFLAAGTGEGVYQSTDEGSSWQLASSGIHESKVTAVAAAGGVSLLAGTYKGGLYIETPPVTTGSGGEPPIPLASRLFPNYPNPFNPGTTLRYAVAAAGRVTLTIYDLLGRACAVLADRVEGPGTYEAAWDASAFPAGVYLARFSAGKEHETRKLLLMK